MPARTGTADLLRPPLAERFNIPLDGLDVPTARRAMVQLVADGWVEVTDEDGVVADAAWLAGAEPGRGSTCGLTAAGFAGWERLARPDWSRCVERGHDTLEDEGPPWLMFVEGTTAAVVEHLMWATLRALGRAGEFGRARDLGPRTIFGHKRVDHWYRCEVADDGWMRSVEWGLALNSARSARWYRSVADAAGDGAEDARGDHE